MTPAAGTDRLIGMTEPLSADVAIIGAGPVGLFAVFECGMLQLSSVVIDALAEPGGQCTALYPEKPIYDIPAHPAIEAADLIGALERQIAPFRAADAARPAGGTAFRRGAATSRSAPTAARRCAAKAVIIAAGAGAFGPNRPPLDDLPAYEATGAVQYYVRRREDLRGQHVVIAGGGDSAVDWALALRGIAASIAVVHRRAKFRAAPESAAQLDAAAARGEVEMVIPYQLHALHGEAARLAAVEVADLDGDTRHLPADRAAAVLRPVDRSRRRSPSWGLALERHHVPVTPATCETSVPGVFAIGDVADYPGKLKLILQGFSEASMAAHAIHPIVRPGVGAAFRVFDDEGRAGRGVKGGPERVGEHGAMR